MATWIRHGVLTALARHGAEGVLPTEPPEPGTDAGRALAFVIGTAFLVAAADGSLAAIERATLIRTMNEIVGLTLDEAAWSEFLHEANSALAKYGYAASIADLAQHEAAPARRRAAFIVAAAVACSDGVLTNEEAAVFESLAGAYALPPETAQAIVEQIAQAYLDAHR
jgi:tellurite resistance protein